MEPTHKPEKILKTRSWSLSDKDSSPEFNELPESDASDILNSKIPISKTKNHNNCNSFGSNVSKQKMGIWRKSIEIKMNSLECFLNVRISSSRLKNNELITLTQFTFGLIQFVKHERSNDFSH